MARIARVVAPRLPHHVTQRGNRRAPVFFGAEDHQLYRRLIAAAARRAGAEIWAYCLMPDHVHPIVTPADRNGPRKTFGEAHRRNTGAINARVPLDRPSFPGSLRPGGDGRAAPAGGGRLHRAQPSGRGGRVSVPGTTPWSSARAHLAGEDDELATGRRYARPDFVALLAALPDPATTARIERAPTIGRPLGAPEWIAALDRPLAPGTPGPKPPVDTVRPSGSRGCCRYK
jgi:putative transposase